jgi:hypothetical protein
MALASLNSVHDGTKIFIWLALTVIVLDSASPDRDFAQFLNFWSTKIENLSPSEARFVETLAAKTAGVLPPKYQPEETSLVVRGLFLRNLLLGKLGEDLLPPTGIVMQDAKIIGDVDLRGCNVSCPIRLERCKVLGVLDFSGAPIVELGLTGTSVERLCLSQINCRGNIILNSGFRTLHEVVVIGAKIGGQLGCSGGEFLGYPLAISIESAEIQGAFFWRHVKGLWGIVDLTNACVGCLVDDPDSWPSKGHLRLSGFTYGSLESNTSTSYYDRIDWLERQYEPHLTDDFRPQPFEQLVKVLRATGREVEATKIAINKLNLQRNANFLRRNRKVIELNDQIRRTNIPFGRVFLEIALAQERKLSFDNIALFLIAGWIWVVSSMFLVFAGYGYRPARCIFWSIFMIILGGWVFSNLYENGNIIHVTQSLMSDFSGREANVTTFYPTAYAADVFIPLIDLRQTSNWILIEGQGESIRPFLLFNWVYIFLGWVFAAIFGASVTGLVRK